MANTPGTFVRVEPALIEDAARCAGLPERISVSEVIRYALAVVAGKPDPFQVAASRRGPKPKPESDRESVGAAA